MKWTIGCLVLVWSGAAVAQAPEFSLNEAERRCPREVRELILSTVADSGGFGPPPRRRDGWLWVRADEALGSGVDGAVFIEDLLVHQESCFHVTIASGWETAWPGQTGFFLANAPVPPPIEWVRLLTQDPVEELQRSSARHALARLWFGINPRRVWARTRPRPGHRVWVQPVSAAVQPWLPGQPVEPPLSVYDSASGELVRFGGEARRTQVGAYSVVEVAAANRFETTAIAVVEGGRHRWLFATADGAVGRPYWVGEHGGWLFAVVSAAHLLDLDFGASLLAIRPADGAARVLHFPMTELSEEGTPRATRACAAPDDTHEYDDDDSHEYDDDDDYYYGDDDDDDDDDDDREPVDGDHEYGCLDAQLTARQLRISVGSGRPVGYSLRRILRLLNRRAPVRAAQTSGEPDGA